MNTLILALFVFADRTVPQQVFPALSYTAIEEPLALAWHQERPVSVAYMTGELSIEIIFLIESWLGIADGSGSQQLRCFLRISSEM
ncbi:MAG: hypothetical protein R3F50_19055 [Gammaproteobacteria bacterium]